MISIDGAKALMDGNEALLLHHLAKNKEEAKARVIRMLEEVGIPEPALRYRSWPHELSGGMRQQVVIAMAAICGPKLLIADEASPAPSRSRRICWYAMNVFRHPTFPYRHRS